MVAQSFNAALVGQFMDSLRCVASKTLSFKKKGNNIKIKTVIGITAYW